MFKAVQTGYIFILRAVVMALLMSTPAAATLVLGPEELVEANGRVIKVPGYSVPSFVHWNDDSLPDLVVGEGGGGVAEGKVRVYMNIGSGTDPRFGDYFYAQSEGSDLVCPGSG